MSTSTPPLQTTANVGIVLVEPVHPKRRWRIRKTDLSNGVALAVTVSRQVVGGDVCAFMGYSMRETTGTAAAQVRLHDGTGDTGELLAVIELAAGTSDNMPPVPPGIEVSTGSIWVEMVNGSVDGVIYWV